MSYKGRFRPHNPTKYKGNPTNIIYRSLWEFKFMRYLDNDPRIVEWASEEFFVPYHDPSSGRKRRYFPDFWAKTVEKTIVFEIKPFKETLPPELPKVDLDKHKGRKRILKEALTYATNQAKWEAAKKYCEEKGWEFKVLTERELGI